jgi:DNA polymerase III subunit delta
MTGAQLLARVQRKNAPAAVLLLGPEAYQRRRIKSAMLASVPADAVTEYDLTEHSLAEVIDDARSLSLFAAERLIWVGNAEAALPRGRASEETEAEGESASGDAAPLAAYLKDPTPGTVLAFEAIRFDFEGDDKRKQDRVRKFYAAISEVVELRRLSSAEARQEADALLKRAGLGMEPDAADFLVEAMGADIARIAIEIEKLALFAQGRTIGVEDITALVPDARSATIFALVNALGRRDRTRALETLDTLVREGVYLPLALSFLSTQFRMALAAREAALKSPQQVQGHFNRMGVPMWQSRAEQVHQTMSKFTKPQLERAVAVIYSADKNLRDLRPDDRVVMEQFILQLVGTDSP